MNILSKLYGQMFIYLKTIHVQQEKKRKSTQQGKRKKKKRL